MLDASRTHPWQALVEGDLLALPFADRSFDVVVCCRLLHHLDDRALELVLGELSRVTRRLLIVSYWSGSSWPGWRRRLRLGRLDPAGRRERSDAELTAALTRRGFAIRELHRPVGRLSNQAFLVGARD